MLTSAALSEFEVAERSPKYIVGLTSSFGGGINAALLWQYQNARRYMYTAEKCEVSSHQHCFLIALALYNTTQSMQHQKQGLTLGLVVPLLLLLHKEGTAVVKLVHRQIQKIRGTSCELRHSSYCQQAKYH